MSSCRVNVQVMSGREMSTDPEGRVVSSCVCIFSSWTNRHLFRCLFWDHLLVFSDIEKRTSSLVNKRVLMQGFRIVFLVTCCQINITWFWVCDRGQTMSQEPAELHCPEQFPDQINAGWLLWDGLVVLYSLFHSMKKGAISKHSRDGQTAHVLPTCMLFNQTLFPSPPLLSSLLVVFCRHFPQMTLLEPNWNKRPYPHSAVSPLTTKYFQSVERVFSSLFRVLWLPTVTAVSVWFEGSFACAVTGSFC